MALHRMDHVGLVVDDLPAAIAFFEVLGLELEGEARVGGSWADRLLALDDVDADIAMMRMADGSARLELSQFRHPLPTEPAPRAAVNVAGIPRLTFVVDDLAGVLDRLRPLGAELVGEISRYENQVLYAYTRGPAGVVLGLVQELT